MNTHNVKTIDRINIHIKQTQHDILKRNNKQENWGGGGGGGGGDGGTTPLIISASLSLFNESSNLETSKFKNFIFGYH